MSDLERYGIDLNGKKALARVLEKYPELTKEAKTLSEEMACGCPICVLSALKGTHPDKDLWGAWQKTEGEL